MSLLAELGERFSGPMAFRLVLQPVMATILAVIAGRRDARVGAPPYLIELLTHSGHRREMLWDLWRGVGRVFLLAVAMEVAYQFAVTSRVSVVETIGVSVVLAIVPYIVLRGLVNRWVRKD
jgi:uncharacterized membrane protein YdfJ with MMPL/SSD domain